MGPPIEPQRLIERLPTRLQSRKPVTVEIRIARTAVLATGAAASGRDEMLTRAVAVRLRAPEGGFHIENAAPETQWFETKSSQRDDAEVRWRWLVTPHHPGRRPLQLSITMRAIASDGIAVETVLPEHQVTVNVGTNYAHAVRTWATYAAAALTGAMLAMLASGGWKSLLG